MATLLSVVVTPTSSSIPVGKTEQLTATGYYNDGTTQDLTSTATWVSGTTSVATIAATGIATGVAVGSSIITATSGGVSGTATLRIGAAQHLHTSESFIINSPLGHLKFRQSFLYDAPQVVAGPDPHPGHINNRGGSTPATPATVHTIIIQPKPRDALQPILEIRADIPAPRFAWGQEGRMLKDSAFPIKPIVESSTSSDSTAGVWRRGKVFAGNIKF
jgi:hypothetical protein